MKLLRQLAKPISVAVTLFAAPLVPHAALIPGPDPIVGLVTTAQTLSSGTGTVNGTLSVSGSAVAITLDGTVLLINNGSILQTGTGRALRNNTNTAAITITNNAGAVIQAADADAFQMNQSNSSVVFGNFGSVLSPNPSGGGNQAIDWNAIGGAANTLNNYSTGVIRAEGADAVRPGLNGVIVNDGTIEAVPRATGSPGALTATSSDGIDAQARSGAQITNSGAISGRHGITGGESLPNFTLTVSNLAGGTITGVNGAGINIDGSTASAAVVSFVDIVNYGSIIGRFDSAKYDVGDGDGVDVDGRVRLDNYGVIRGIGAGGNGSDGLPNNAEGVSIGGGTIVNRAGAEITGENPTGTGAKGNGILVDNSSGGSAFAAVEVTNDGLIRGFAGFAFKAIGDFADTIVNGVTGVLRGAGAEAAVQTGGGADTVVNRGLIRGDGGKAIDLGGGNDTLRVVGGSAAIAGDVTGGAGANLLELEIGAGNVFAYDGVFSDFAEVRVASGTVLLGGANTYTGTTTVEVGATLGGNGSIAGALVVEPGGTVAPGQSVGVLGVGSLSLLGGGALAIEIDGVAGIADLLRVTGQVLLEGDLLVTLLSAPAIGDAFDVLVNDGLDALLGRFAQGDFVSAQFGGRTYAFAIDYAANIDGGALANDVRLVLVAVPEPSALALLLAAAAALATVRRRRGR